jgi:hypothetical protein
LRSLPEHNSGARLLTCGPRDGTRGGLHRKEPAPREGAKAMGIPTVGVMARAAGQLPCVQEMPLALCPVRAAAGLLRALGREVDAAAAEERAIGLGLLRCLEAGRPAALTARRLSRLLLAGYGLPAAVEESAAARASQHVDAGRLVFVLLPALAGEGTEFFQVHRDPLACPEQSALIVTEVGTGPAAAWQFPQEEWLPAWSRTGNFAVVALRRWSDMPTEGRLFFAGDRDRHGTYYWHTAECETDAAGRVLRYG